MKRKLFLIGLISLFLFSCSKDNDSKLENDVKWWVLVHPNSDSGNPGIYLYNETDSKTEKHFQLPSAISSPQALFFDGETLWLGSTDANRVLYGLNPNDGSILVEIENLRMNGIVSDGSFFYVSTCCSIDKLGLDGSYIESYSVNTTGVTDLTIVNSQLYYIINGEIDPIIKIDLETGLSDTILNTNIKAATTLTNDQYNFVVIGENNALTRFDIETREKKSTSIIELDGWITAVARSY